MSATQDNLSISDISEGIIVLKDGGGAIILQTSAVNFGLLSEREQLAIIEAFAQMLNSLSFSIQIMIHSERLNISSYLNLLFRARNSQTNPLLAQMMTNYIEFIQATVKENDVLDKKFYIVIPLYALELGITPSKESLQQKIKTILLPRRDQVVRQLKRIGLKTIQLTEKELISLFYDLYNGLPEQVPSSEPLRLNKPVSEVVKTVMHQSQVKPASPAPSIPPNPARNHPFVVEELDENA